MDILRKRLIAPLSTVKIPAKKVKPSSQKVRHLYFHIIWRDSWQTDFADIFTYLETTVFPDMVLWITKNYEYDGPIEVHWISTCCDVGSFQKSDFNRRNSSDPRCDDLRHVLEGLSKLAKNSFKDIDSSCTEEHIFGMINGLDYPCRDMRMLNKNFFNLLETEAAKSASH